MDIKYSKCVTPNLCRNCGGKFPNWAVIDGKRVSLGQRTYCLECSPYTKGKGNGNKTKLELYRTADGVKQKLCIGCKTYLVTDSFYCYLGQDGLERAGSRCKSCTHAHYVSIKCAAVAYMGGKCSDCDGRFHYSVFDFHHLDPKQKDMNVMYNHPKTLDIIKPELDKCVLLCSNCHRLRHNDTSNKNYCPLRAE